MEILMFLYNIILIMIFGAVCTLAFANYKKNKSPLYPVVGLLFLIYICDNTIIYMTEFIIWFSHQYDTQFMTVPAFKTISILSQSACILYICNGVLKRKTTFFQYLVFLTQAIFLMFIPMMRDSALKVWLYYLPCQLYQFWLGFYGLNILKRKKNKDESSSTRVLIKLLRFTVVFAVLILIEDTIVIFNVDIYSQLIVRIHNRNICEDILTLIYSYYGIRTLFSQLITTPQPVDQMLNQEPVILLQPQHRGNLYDTDKEMIDHFSDRYDLTTREQEIFSYLVKDMSNQEICEKLCISIGTVKAHIHNIFGKLNVVKRSQVLRIYKEFGKEWANKDIS